MHGTCALHPRGQTDAQSNIKIRDDLGSCALLGQVHVAVGTGYE